MGLLLISCDGASQNSYETHRKGGNFDLVIGNMKKLCSLKKKLKRGPWIEWGFLVFRHNESEMDKAHQMADEIGVDSICFRMPYINTETHPDWISTLDEFNMYGERRETSNTMITCPKFPLLPWKRAACDWLWISCAINANGSVSPCCGIWDQKDDFGNLQNSSLWRVWNNAKYWSARGRQSTNMQSNEEIVCQRCPMPNEWNYARNWNQKICREILESLRKR